LEALRPSSGLFFSLLGKFFFGASSVPRGWTFICSTGGGFFNHTFLGPQGPPPRASFPGLCHYFPTNFFFWGSNQTSWGGGGLGVFFSKIKKKNPLLWKFPPPFHKVYGGGVGGGGGVFFGQHNPTSGGNPSTGDTPVTPFFFFTLRGIFLLPQGTFSCPLHFAPPY